MKASETNFQPIIEGAKQYVVPLFQRAAKNIHRFCTQVIETIGLSEEDWIVETEERGLNNFPANLVPKLSLGTRLGKTGLWKLSELSKELCRGKQCKIASPAFSKPSLI